MSFSLAFDYWIFNFARVCVWMRKIRFALYFLLAFATIAYRVQFSLCCFFCYSLCSPIFFQAKRKFSLCFRGVSFSVSKSKRKTSFCLLITMGKLGWIRKEKCSILEEEWEIAHLVVFLFLSSFRFALVGGWTGDFPSEGGKINSKIAQLTGSKQQQELFLAFLAPKAVRIRLLGCWAEQNIYN